MLLMVSVDDVSGETISHVIEEVMAEGAANVHVVPAITKKGRPEYLFYVDAPEEMIETIATFFAKELGTIGMRILEARHIPFNYRFKKVLIACDACFDVQPTTVRVKEVLNGEDKVVSVKADYEDLKAALLHLKRTGLFDDVSFTALKGLAEQTVLGRSDRSFGKIDAKYTGDFEK